MFIRKKRINNIAPYIHHVPIGSKIIVGITDPNRFSSILHRIGFTEPYDASQTVLPAGIGPMSTYNAEGKNLIHKNKPMETAFRQIIWHWKQWDGYWYSKPVDVPYKRYPRSFVPPPAVEITITQDTAGRQIIIAPGIEKTEKNEESLKHVVNLFLELFGECQFYTEDLEAMIKSSIRRLNWTILPQGEMPWEQVRSQFDPIVKLAPKGNQEILYYRLKTVNELKPDFRAVGNAGFHGYIIHGFTKKGIFVLESMYYGNATYIFDEAWEDLSKRTKAEILSENLQKARIIHRQGWRRKLEQLMEEVK